jgi:hypothetical protein
MDKLRVYVHESRCKRTSHRRVMLYGPHEAINEEMPSLYSQVELSPDNGAPNGFAKYAELFTTWTPVAIIGLFVLIVSS